MSVSAVSSTPSMPLPAAQKAAPTAEMSSTAPSVPSVSNPPARNVALVNTTSVTADGDSKVRTAHTSQIKDADGDYKPLKATSASAKSSSAVQSSLALLTKGG